MKSSILKCHLSFFISLFMGVCLLCCSTEPEKKVVVKNYSDGTFDSVEVNKKDSIPIGYEKKFSKDRLLMSVRNYVDGKLEGKGIYYYPNSKIRCIVNYSNDRMIGNALMFYPNGNIADSGYQVDWLEVGQHKTYFENDSGKVQFISDYIIVMDKSYPNVWAEYDSLGKIVGKSPEVTQRVLNDTLILELANNEFPNMVTLVGDFDSLYFIANRERVDSFKATGYVSKIPLSFYREKKMDLIRGIVSNYYWSKEREIISRDCYFSYSLK